MKDDIAKLIKYFLDTNIIIYAHDKTDITKQTKSIELIADNSRAVLSIQVIRKFTSLATKKFAVPMETELINVLLDQVLQPLPVTLEETDVIKKALELKNRYNYSFYDLMIISTALMTSCSVLYSEDLQHNQNIETLKIINPSFSKNS